MNDYLSKQLHSFDRDCKSAIQVVQKTPSVDEVMTFIQKQILSSENDQKHSNDGKATPNQIQYHQSQDQGTVVNFGRSMKRNQGFSTFLKMKDKLRQSIETSPTKKTSKKNPFYEQKKQPINLMKTVKLYKPNPMMANIFSHQTSVNLDSDEFQIITQKEKKQFFQNLSSLTLRTDKKCAEDENKQIQINEQEEKSLYRLNPHLMAPKKMKIKRLESNHNFK